MPPVISVTFRIPGRAGSLNATETLSPVVDCACAAAAMPNITIAKDAIFIGSVASFQNSNVSVKPIELDLRTARSHPYIGVLVAAIDQLAVAPLRYRRVRGERRGLEIRKESSVERLHAQVGGQVGL